MIASKAQHVAEAERVLDQVRDLVNGPLTQSVATAVAYAQAHAMLALAYPGVVEAADLAAARAKVADPGSGAEVEVQLRSVLLSLDGW